MNTRLPLDFNSEEYLILNPDVKKTGIDAKKHYLTFGINENREYKISTEIKKLVAKRLERIEKKWVLQVSCLMMQKNEGELLRAWIEYHGNIFGLFNLWIYDNGSDDPLTLEILSFYEGAGVNIIYSKKTPLDFENKGKLILQLIKFLDLFSIYNFFFPLDCDEFVGVKSSDKKYSINHEAVTNELLKYIDCEEVLTIHGSLVNKPSSTEQFVFDIHNKCFFSKDTADDLDVGFHCGISRKSTSKIQTNIIYIHLHNKPLEKLIYFAKEKLKLRVDIKDENCLKKYSGPGFHLRSYINLSEEDYQKKYDGREFIIFNDLFNSFKKLNINWPYENTEMPSVNGELHFLIKHLTFPRAINCLFNKVVTESKSILEYGSGCSTKFISQSNRFLLSIDSDKKFIDSLKNEIDMINSNNNVSLLHIDIGHTKEWGYPSDNSKKLNWPTYALKPWEILNNLNISPDLVLIDGRFRVACMLATLANISKPTKIIFDDYIDRSYKKIIEKFCKPVKLVDRAAYFEIAPGEICAKDILDCFNFFFEPS